MQTKAHDKSSYELVLKHIPEPQIHLVVMALEIVFTPTETKADLNELPFYCKYDHTSDTLRSKFQPI